MKIAVINFSGNVGKTTVAKHLLLPRMAGAEYIAVESVNAGADDAPSVRGSQFAKLMEYLHTVEHAVVDIGASSAEELMGLMRDYEGSIHDFDCFIVPTVPPLKQQQDTIATLIELARQGASPSGLKVLFNLVDNSVALEDAFYLLLDFLAEEPIATADTACQLRSNEIYARIRGKKGRQADIAALAHDETDYKQLIVRAADPAAKIGLAKQLATTQLARSVVRQHDACFAALALDQLVQGAAANGASP